MAEQSFLYKHAGVEYEAKFAGSETLEGLKRKIEEQTNVLPKRQKILGIKKVGGGLPGDGDALSECALKTGQRYMVLG